MGREVRRVPPGWEHPRDERGRFIPLFDGAALARDVASAAEDGDEAPNPEDYTPVWTAEEATAWCIYETVSEGTPWSPVVNEPESLRRWLVGEKGYTPGAAAAFLVQGWGPTFIAHGGRLYDAVESAELP